MTHFVTPLNLDTTVADRVGVKLDAFESRWNHASEEVGRPRIEDFLDGTSELERSVTLYWLLGAELELLRTASEQPDRQTYLDRFPCHVAIVTAVFDEEDSTVHTSHSTVFRTETGNSARRPRQEMADEKSKRFGDYDLYETLGDGAMGIVYRALQRSTGRLVALKMIRPERLIVANSQAKRDLIERFRREARAAAKVTHDHIVTIYEVGEFAGVDYYSMRYVAGASLASEVQKGPLAPMRAATYLEPVAQAIQALHEVGVLHRDLKPSNIIVEGESGRPFVADFGLARLREAEHPVPSTVAGILGTPQYMAPEQARDPAQVTGSADVYSLGATLYHLLTARPPFQAANAEEVLRQIADMDPVSPRRLNPEIDRDLETICLKCLEKSPEQRYLSAGMLADDLHRYINGQPIAARPIGRIRRVLKWARRRPAIAMMAFLLSVSIAMGSTTATWQAVRASRAEQRAQANLTKARETLDYMGHEIAEVELA
jgi:tRNA A-37 threonylcarbamoyl transferase component Bud32